MVGAYVFLGQNFHFLINVKNIAIQINKVEGVKNASSHTNHFLIFRGSAPGHPPPPPRHSNARYVTVSCRNNNTTSRLILSRIIRIRSKFLGILRFP